jgi:hypothetical protein
MIQEFLGKGGLSGAASAGLQPRQTSHQELMEHGLV